MLKSRENRSAFFLGSTPLLPAGTVQPVRERVVVWVCKLLYKNMLRSLVSSRLPSGHLPVRRREYTLMETGGVKFLSHNSIMP